MRISERLPNILKYPPPDLTSLVKMIILIIGFCKRLPNILKYPPLGLTSLVKMMILIIGFCERLPNILKCLLTRYVLAVKWRLEEFSFTGSHKLYFLEVFNKVSLENMTKASIGHLLASECKQH